MISLSHRSINYVAKVLENGYTHDRIETVFIGVGVPKDLLKIQGGKFVYSTKVMCKLLDSLEPKHHKILLAIVEEALKGEFANPAFFLGPTYYEAKGKLENSLKLDGYKFEKGKLVLYTREEIAKEEGIFERKLRELGFDETIVYLEQSYDNYTRGNWEAANDSTRKVLEHVTREITEKIATRKKEELGKGHKAVRTYMRRSSFLDDKESNVLSHLYSWLSERGGHPGLSNETESRLRRIVVISLCQYYLERYETYMAEGVL